MVRGEKPIELGDSWFYAKPIKVGRALSEVLIKLTEKLTKNI